MRRQRRQKEGQIIKLQWLQLVYLLLRLKACVFVWNPQGFRLFKHCVTRTRDSLVASMWDFISTGALLFLQCLRLFALITPHTHITYISSNKRPRFVITPRFLAQCLPLWKHMYCIQTHIHACNVRPHNTATDITVVKFQRWQLTPCDARG